MTNGGRAFSRLAIGGVKASAGALAGFAQAVLHRVQRSICEFAVIDPDGYRPNVGIILSNHAGQVFWARRIRRDGWQFPQGGMNSDETPLEAMYRELHEETGLAADAIEVLGATSGWLRYRLPQRHLRNRQGPVCIGQKQVWFLLRLLADEDKVRLDHTDEPEFDRWRWVDYWYPMQHVVHFKRNVYARALLQLAPLVGIEPCAEVGRWVERDHRSHRASWLRREGKLGARQ